MDRLRFVSLAALALGTLAASSARSPGQQGPTWTSPVGPACCVPSYSSDSDDLTCVAYSLADLGNDPDLGKWVAETIPEVIAPGTWKGKGVLRYYAPKKLLVVYHNAATQARVDAFLKSVKKSLPAANEKTIAAANGVPACVCVRTAPVCETAVVPADFRVPGKVRGFTTFADPSSSYPVPASATRPKHLFHFIIRYEGEGIVDDNVVKAMKTQFQGKKREKGPDPLVGSPSSASGGSISVPTASPYVSPGAVLSVPPAELLSRPTSSAGQPVPATTAQPTGSSAPPAPANTTQPGTDKKESKKSDKKEKDDEAP
jgi:hypothetical protein